MGAWQLIWRGRVTLFAALVCGLPLGSAHANDLLDGRGGAIHAAFGQCIQAGSAAVMQLPSACDPIAGRIVLLPGPNGSVGALTVRSAAGESRLDSAYAAAEVSASGKIFGRKKNAESVALRYAAELGAQARRPVSFTVYYATASATELTPESIPVIEALKSELAKRPAPEITVIGHTDSVGTDEANDLLSLQRAQSVRQVLIESGVQAVSIDATGRGEREPLVATPNEVDEPRNRRVEISVR